MKEPALSDTDKAFNAGFEYGLTRASWLCQNKAKYHSGTDAARCHTADYLAILDLLKQVRAGKTTPKSK
jgi:hypothetical protein